MKKIQVKLTSGQSAEFDINTTYYDIYKFFDVKNNVLGVKNNNVIYSLDDRVFEDSEISFIDVSDINGQKIYKSGLMFIFEVALKELYKDSNIKYMHSVPRGFLGEIECDKTLTAEDITNIKNNMSKIINDNLKFKKMNIKKKDAIKFYEQNGCNEKANNIQYISDKAITLYELKNHINYYYSDMPYSTKSINEYDIVYLGRNRVVFVIPSKQTKGILPEYIHYDNIINSFLEGKEWLESMNMSYVYNLNETICSGDIKKFMDSCEISFNMSIIKVVNEIISNRNIKFLLIAGPSSSGKTTTTKRLSSYLRAEGFDPITISIDDFYLNREDVPKDENGEYDFECLHSIDIKFLNEILAKLLNGEEVNLPTFNFITGKRDFENNVVKKNDNTIFLLEGLHALNDELIPGIDNKYKYKIYLSPFLPLNIDKQNYISTTDLRLIRRIIRDNRTRGYDINKTIHCWQSVRNGEEKNIFPFIHQADVIINTALPYEIGVEKVYIEPLLRSVNVNSEYYEEARKLINFLKIFFPITSEFVNKDSIIREFIGGNND